MPWKEVSIMSQRLEFVTLATAEEANIRHLCRCYRISSATAYKWLQRFQASGVDGLADRSRRPHHSPSRSAVEMEEAIINLRRKHPAWGGHKLRDRLLALNHTAVPSSSTITAILRRHQLLDPKESAKHRAFQRFERAAPNDLWQMDFKGEFKLPHGRCYPLTILDDHSRFAIALEACARNTRNITQAALIKVFRLYGLPAQITCDNGSPWVPAGATISPAWGSGSCASAFVFLIHDHIILRPKVKTNASIALSRRKFCATRSATRWRNGNSSLTSGGWSTTLSVPMKRSPWLCRPRVINQVTAAIRNSYRQSNMEQTTLCARSAASGTSNMKAANIMSAVPSMVCMSLYGPLSPMVCLMSSFVTIRLASLIFVTTN